MNFKNIFMIAAALFLFSCSDNDSDVFSESKFKIGESYKVDDKNNLEITKINDSRCAIGVTCVRQGEAFIIFKLTEGNISKLDSTFVVGKTGKKDTIFSNLFLNITSLDPHPEKDKTIKQSDYTLTMKVTK
jgi:hypothetical protein